MNTKSISIQQDQFLTDILPNGMIEPNTILNKRLTGLGATFSEIEAKRHSIIIEPNVPVIRGKEKQHKKKVFGVYEGIYADDVLKYLETHRGDYKILTTPESFRKVKDAIWEYGMNIYEDFFLLFDECQKIVQDVCYRQDIALPIDDFFRFRNKAFVSATPILPSDPRFKNNGFKVINIVPEYDYIRNLHLITTNCILGTLRKVLEVLEDFNKENSTSKDVCIFLNSTDTIEAIIKQLEIEKKSAVFCSDKSVAKLNERSYKTAYEHWDEKKMKKYNFFTSRFYSALDIELDKDIDLIMITDLYYAQHSMIDPNTEAPQIIGRFRKKNGVSSVVHITNLNSDLPVRSPIEINLYLKCCEEIYHKIQNLYDTTPDFNYKQAYLEALNVIPYNKFLDRNGDKNHFAIDNYIDEETIKSFYNHKYRLKEAYENTGRFSLIYENAWFPLGDKERLKRERDTISLREKNIETVRQMELLTENGECTSEILKQYRDELYKYNPFIVEAYETIGKEEIERLNYSRPKIKEAMIIKQQENGITKLGFQQMIDNSFPIGSRHTCEFIKQELIRIYDICGITPHKAITGTHISQFFKVKECKIKGKRSYMIVCRL
ncbi:MAG: hypothetical protein E6772_10290 [Dysgonomonas sp.]|nr:hypothetical protein [Dysgonomonas sp.]